jgi:uncharacterized protein (TIGR03382 family)
MIRAYPGGVALTDYTFRARVRATTVDPGYIGVVFRYANASNFYYAAMTTTQLRLVKVVNGTETTISTQAFVRAINTWYTMQIELKGSSIRILINNTQRILATDTSLKEGTFGVIATNQRGQFTGPTSAFELRDAGTFRSFTPAEIRNNWTTFGPGQWTQTTYELRQALNTAQDTGFFQKRFLNLTDYTYIHQMRISPSSDDDVMGLLIRFTQDQASPHRFTSYLFEWSRGGAVAPARRLVRVKNGGYGTHGGTWPRINHTILKSDNTRWAPNTWYTIRVTVKGCNIKVWLDGALWADHTDTAANCITKGSFGPLNWSNPNFNMRHAVLHFGQTTFPNAVTSAKQTATIPATWGRIGTATVGSLLQQPIADWVASNGLIASNVSVGAYKVVFTNADLFEGKVSLTATGNTPTNANAFPYGQEKSGQPRYHIYRNGSRITTTPVTGRSYRDPYMACVPSPGTRYSYEVSMVDRSNAESTRTAAGSITTTNNAPTIAGVPDQTGTHGTAWILDLKPYIKDINVPTSTLLISEDSLYATVLSNQRIRFLYPANAPVSVENVKITVQDCHGASASQTIKVTLANRPPVLLSAPPTSAVEKQVFSYTVAASDPDGDSLNYTLKSGPPGATIDPNTGQLNWTPGTADAGKSFTFEVVVCDNRTPPQCATQKWTVTVINVNDPPNITTSPGTAATEDQPYGYKPQASDSDTGDTQFWRFKKAPPGATIDPTTGEIKWTPGDSEAGKNVDFEIEVCDRAGTCDSQAWKVNVKNVNDKPAITSAPVTTATEKQPYNYKPTATDPDPNDTQSWKLTKAPPGATIDPNTGEIKWTPGTSDGGKDVDFEVEVCDKSGTCTKQSWKVAVNNVNDPPTITSSAPTTAKERQAYNYKPTATDPDAGDQGKLTWKFTNAPKGATIDPNTGEIKWTPDADDVKAGQRTFEVEVCDPLGACAKETWTVKVDNVNDPPTITSSAPTEARSGEPMEYEPKATDPDPNDTLTWSLKNGPVGAQIDPKTGKLVWTPTKADAGKTISFTIEVCDNGTPKSCTTQTFTVPVKQPCVVDIDCPTAQICADGTCVPAGCASNTPKCSNNSNFCKDGTCIQDLCANKTCGPQEVCRPSDGACIKSCNGVTCATGEQCEEGVCIADPCAANPCKADEICDTSDGNNPKCIKDPCGSTSCRFGRVCNKGKCIDDPCSKMTCPNSADQCLAGQCVPRQTCTIDIDCPGDDVCLSGTCFPAGCYPSSPQCSTTGQLCLQASCKANPCLQNGANKCPANQFCRTTDGQCASACSGVTCQSGEQCIDGTCRKDPCAGVKCAAGKACVNGTCVDEQCNQTTACKHGRICRTDLQRCADDPCAGVTCPDPQQVCQLGQCVAPPKCTFDKDCPGTAICVSGACITPTCNGTTGCKQGEVCVNGTCATDPCTGVTCQQGEVCRAGTCVATCAGVFCPQGERCEQGKCIADPCAGVTCKQDETCRNGTCVPNPCKTGDCKGSRVCNVDRCTDDPCGLLTCPSGQQCTNGQCTGTKACKNDAECPGEGVCVSGNCAEPGCYKNANCSNDQVCSNGKCIDNPCNNKQCAADEQCRPSDGTCVKRCPTCPLGQRCENGQCVADPCDGVSCNQGERCENGTCVKDACTAPNTRLCKYNRVCKNETCSDDPCGNLTCPSGESCRDGVCYGPAVTPETTQEPTTQETTQPDAGTPEASTDQTNTEKSNTETTNSEIITTETAITGDGTPDTTSGDRAYRISGGCGCQSTSTTPISLVFFLLLGAFAFRRRRSH